MKCFVCEEELPKTDLVVDKNNKVFARVKCPNCGALQFLEGELNLKKVKK